MIPPAGPASKGSGAQKSKAKRVRSPLTYDRLVADLAQALEPWPRWIFPIIKLFELGTISLFILQIPVTYAAVRLAFEQHWYIVTDRSLRIRTGLIFLNESTMSFANLQQVELQQGPLQRLLGLADVRVQSAGGGGDKSPKHGGDSLHTGVFHGVDNAQEVRDLILDRLRRFREAGLGDAQDPAATAVDSCRGSSLHDSDTLAAAKELLTEARALRTMLASSPP